LQGKVLKPPATCNGLDCSGALWFIVRHLILSHTEGIVFMSTKQAFQWSDRFVLGHGAIDDTHREFVDCVDALLQATDAELPAALERFIAHAQDHFNQENAWLGAEDFPGGGECHIDEHGKVMSSALDVQRMLAEGQTEIVREFTQALVDWFPGHADYMDSALATWLVKQAHNGRPLVFRRKEKSAQ